MAVAVRLGEDWLGSVTSGMERQSRLGSFWCGLVSSGRVRCGSPG